MSTASMLLEPSSGGIHSEETGTSSPLVKKTSDIKVLQTYFDISITFELHKLVFNNEMRRTQAKLTFEDGKTSTVIL